MLHRQTRTIDLFKKDRGWNDRVVFERKGRDRCASPRKAKEIVKARTRGGQPIAFSRPSELCQQLRRIEDAATTLFRPIRFDKSNEPQLIHFSVRRRRGIEQKDTARS